MITIKGKEYSEVELKVLEKAGFFDSLGQKNDPASLTLDAPGLHGPLQGSTTQYGAFTNPGVRPQMFSALSHPRSWLSVVPLTASDIFNEKIEIMTGQTAGSTTNATGWCGNPPTVGYLKTCQQTYTFGSYYVKTNLEALPLQGLRKDRADVPRNILNSGVRENPYIPDLFNRMSDTRDPLYTELYRIGNDAERVMEVVGILGQADTDNSRTGFWKEYAGLDRQIKTGYVDSVTNLACAAADSIVVSFNANITGTDSSSLTFVERLADIAYALKDRARQVGMNGVQWAIVMRQEQFRRATEVLANQYYFYKAGGAQYNERNADVVVLQQLRLEMLNGQFLLVDGEPWPVLFSEGIPNPATASNTYNADIYFVALSWNGTPLVRMDYFNMANEYIQRFDSFQSAKTTTMNNGYYIVGERDTGFCKEYLFGAKMRLIVELPFLCARLDDVQYSYTASTRQSIPGSSLFVNGGVSYRLS